MATTPKKEILEAHWYYSIWNYDPTIQGMLNSLDTIHEVYGRLGQKNSLWGNIKNIQFSLLNMKEFKLHDELYLKMNARGLQLSDFENFKAWLEGYCKDKSFKDNEYFSEKHKEKWTTKIDKEWTDLFWTLSEKEHESKDCKSRDAIFDEYFMKIL